MKELWHHTHLFINIDVICSILELIAIVLYAPIQ